MEHEIVPPTQMGIMSKKKKQKMNRLYAEHATLAVSIPI